MQGGPPILASRGKPGGFVFVGRPRKVLEPARGGGTATYAPCTGNTGAARTKWAQICTWTPDSELLNLWTSQEKKKIRYATQKRLTKKQRETGPISLPRLTRFA